MESIQDFSLFLGDLSCDFLAIRQDHNLDQSKKTGRAARSIPRPLGRGGRM